MESLVLFELIVSALFFYCLFLLFYKEISRLASQIRRLYGSNKKAMQPFHLFLAGMKEDSLLYKECIRMNEGFLNYLVSTELIEKVLHNICTHKLM